MNKYYIRIKSEWQKDDCINSDCKEDSKFELVAEDSMIRFCGQLDCLEIAKKFVIKADY